LLRKSSKLLNRPQGADLFIDAIEIANARSHEPVHALMIGEGEDLPSYKEDVKRRGLSDRIQFLPPMPIKDVFKRTSNLVVPSRAEALPYIVVEALGARVPTLSTSVGGIPEIYGSYGHYLLPPGDANEGMCKKVDKVYLRNLAKIYLPEVDPSGYFSDEEDVEFAVYAK